MSVDELIGDSLQEPNPSRRKFLSGLETLFNHPQHGVLFLDPVIRAFLEGEKEEIFQNSIFDILTTPLTSIQKKEFSIEILKVLASLVGADGKITNEEQTFFSSLLESMQLKDKSKVVARALTSKHFPVEGHAFWKNAPHLKHFLIWMMFFLAKNDDDVTVDELDFIEECSTRLRVNRSNFLFIKKFFVKDKY
jgi:hypothetical protein